MSVQVLTRDTEALPDDLLTLAKEHMRVDHSEDNNFIKSCIARAIANIEQRNDVTINPTDRAVETNSRRHSLVGSGQRAGGAGRSLSRWIPASRPLTCQRQLFEWR